MRIAGMILAFFLVSGQFAAFGDEADQSAKEGFKQIHKGATGVAKGIHKKAKKGAKTIDKNAKKTIKKADKDIKKAVD